MNVAELTDTYDVHQWRILRSPYRKLAQVGSEPTTTEICSGALTTELSGHEFNSHSEPTL